MVSDVYEDDIIITMYIGQGMLVFCYTDIDLYQFMYPLGAHPTDLYGNNVLPPYQQFLVLLEQENLKLLLL